MEQNKQAFTYTYSAAQQEEIKRIRQKYLPPEENKMQLLRKLDEQATAPGKIAALVIGIVSALVLGIGMCCAMLWTQFFVLGVIIGIVGIAGVCASYPVYSSVTKRRRKQLAPEIMRLSTELVGNV